MSKTRPSVDRIKQLMTLDPNTGILQWRDAESCRRAGKSPQWVGRFAGKPALTATNGSGYKTGTVDGYRVVAHRVIWAMHNGTWPQDNIDHISGKRAQNQVSNLREVTLAQNQKNMKRNKRNTTGIAGVSQDKKTLRFRAKVGNVYSEYFATIEEAAAAVLVARAKHGFHPNHGAR